MIFNQESITRFRELTENSDSIVFIPHQNPDGDAIGSILGWLNVFRNRGKIVKVVVPDEVPSNLMWMTGAENIVVYGNNQEKAEKLLKSADLFFLLDFNVIDRCGDMSQTLTHLDTPRILIDHHPRPQQGIAEVLFSEISVSSTCELSFHIIKALEWQNDIDTAAAECLYSGIITDTGSLSYNSSHPRTYKAVADLVEKGIKKDKIHRELFQSNTFNRMKLLGHVLCNKLELIDEGEAAYIAISRDELDAFGYLPGDTEGFVNYPLGIKGVKISALFTEKEKGKFVKLSLRSHNGFPINLYSEAFFSGGGHPNAAGGEWYGTLNEAIEHLRTTLPGFVNKLNKK